MPLSLDLKSHRDVLKYRLQTLFNKAGLPPALVVGDSINALGVARSLAKERVPVILLSASPQSFVYASRAVAIGLTCTDIDSQILIAYLEDIGSLFPHKPVLFLTHDYQVLNVSLARDSLVRMYLFQLPDHGLISALISKTRFYSLATKYGLRVPPTHAVSNLHDLTAIGDFIAPGETWIAKPDQKSDTFESQFGKATSLTSREDWDRFAFKYAQYPEPIVLQPHIPGPDSNVRFCLGLFDSTHQCISSFTGAKIRQYKPTLGNTASAVPDINSLVQSYTLDFFHKCGFSGIGSMEFKLGSFDSRYYAIEPTVGRTDLQSELAPLNGCNIPHAYYKSLVFPNACISPSSNNSSNCSHAKSPIMWMRFPADLRSSIYCLKQGQLSFQSWLCPYIKPFALAVWRIDDPLPLLVLLAHKMIFFAKSSVAKFIKKFVN